MRRLRGNKANARFCKCYIDVKCVSSLIIPQFLASDRSNSFAFVGGDAGLSPTVGRLGRFALLLASLHVSTDKLATRIITASNEEQETLHR